MDFNIFEIFLFRHKKLSDFDFILRIKIIRYKINIINRPLVKRFANLTSTNYNNIWMSP